MHIYILAPKPCGGILLKYVSYTRSGVHKLFYRMAISAAQACSVRSSPIRSFADDTNLFLYGKSIEDLQSDASRNIILLHNWFIANKLSLSIEKTCYSLFGATETKKSQSFS